MSMALPGAPRTQATLKTFFEQFHCISPVFPSHDLFALLRVSSDKTIADAFKLMIDNKVKSIPVFDVHSGKARYVISIMDIVHLFVSHYTVKDFHAGVWNRLNKWVEGTDTSSPIPRIPLDKAEEYLDASLDDAYTVLEHQPAVDALKLLVEKGAHRVVVVDKDARLKAMITQSRMLAFLPVFMDSVPIHSRTLAELGMGVADVCCASLDESAFSAFKKMLEARVSALAVVDAEGRLVGNISASDIKLVGFDASYWAWLGLPVREYLKKLKEKAKELRHSKVEWLDGEPARVTLTETFANVVKLLNFLHVHRVWVVDAQMHPVGVVSMGDCLRATYNSLWQA